MADGVRHRSLSIQEAREKAVKKIKTEEDKG